MASSRQRLRIACFWSSVRAPVVHHQLRVHQAEMGESVLCFLIGGVAEQPGQLAVAKLLGHLCKEQVFAISHALAAESGFEVGLGAGLGEIHGLRCDRPACCSAVILPHLSVVGPTSL